MNHLSLNMADLSPCLNLKKEFAHMCWLWERSNSVRSWLFFTSADIILLSVQTFLSEYLPQIQRVQLFSFISTRSLLDAGKG